MSIKYETNMIQQILTIIDEIGGKIRILYLQVKFHQGTLPENSCVAWLSAAPEGHPFSWSRIFHHSHEDVLSPPVHDFVIFFYTLTAK